MITIIVHGPICEVKTSLLRELRLQYPSVEVRSVVPRNIRKNVPLTPAEKQSAYRDRKQRLLKILDDLSEELEGTDGE